MEEQAKVPVFKGSLIYGLIVGLAMVVLSLILYFIDQSFSKWAMIVVPIISVALLVLALILLRNEYGKGFITYGRVLAAGLLISFFSGIISSAYTVTIYSIDESYFQDTKYYALDKVDKQFDKMDAKYQERMSDDQYAEVEDMMSKQKKKAIKKIKQRTPSYFAIMGIVNSVFMGLIISLIAGIFIKKGPKPLAQ